MESVSMMDEPSSTQSPSATVGAKPALDPSNSAATATDAPHIELKDVSRAQSDPKAEAVETDSERIALGDYIVIQRQKYTKLQKIGSPDATTVLGKECLELGGLLGQPYSATFRMCSKETPAGHRGRHGPRLHTLQLCSETELRDLREVLQISESGTDNRHVQDDGASQLLRPADIEALRESCRDSSKIIERIVEHSKTFSAKTEYAQEKYLRKKEQKYFEFVQIRRPTLRLLLDIYVRQDPAKVLGLRIDTLSQLLSYSNVSSSGNFMLYESGSNGLLPAALLNSMGANTDATLLHLHPGNVPQRQAILALNMQPEQEERCVSVNIYSVLRAFHQLPAQTAAPDVAHIDLEEPDLEEPDLGEPCAKKLKPETPVGAEAGTAKWQLENERGCELLRGKLDCLVIAAKEHPSSLVHALLPFVKPSRPLVVFSSSREVLMQLYVQLKSASTVTNLHLTTNWMRWYQILPNRTHPDVNMTPNDGFLLTGYTVTSSATPAEEGTAAIVEKVP